MSKYNRRGGAPVTMGYVQGVRENYPPQYLHPKYLVFIERALNLNLEVILYMPQDSVSKYVTVRRKRTTAILKASGFRKIAKWVESHPLEYGQGYWMGFVSDDKPLLLLS